MAWPPAVHPVAEPLVAEPLVARVAPVGDRWSCLAYTLSLVINGVPGNRFAMVAALAVAMTGELLDMRDDIASLGYWRWGASLHDIANTVFWPAVLAALARWSSVLGRRP